MSALIEMLVLAGFLVKCYVNSSSEMDNLKKVFSQDHCVKFFFNYMNQSFSTKILIGMVKDAIHCQIVILINYIVLTIWLGFGLGFLACN